MRGSRIAIIDGGSRIAPRKDGPHASSLLNAERTRYFYGLGHRAKLITAGKIPQSVQLAPFDDKALVADGFWIQANDIDCMKAVRMIESALLKDHPGLFFVWSPEAA
jgi:hypothetical protein